MGRDPEELAGQAGRTRDLTLGRATCDLHDLTAAFYRAAGSLTGACPAEDRFTALGRLDAKQRQLQALRQGIDAIQPVLSKFENSLNDSQRTQLAIAIAG